MRFVPSPTLMHLGLAQLYLLQKRMCSICLLVPLYISLNFHGEYLYSRKCKAQNCAVSMDGLINGGYQSIRRQNGKNKVEINKKQVFKSLGLDKSYVKGRSQKSVTLHLSCDIREIEWLPWFHETKVCGTSGQQCSVRQRDSFSALHLRIKLQGN